MVSYSWPTSIVSLFLLLFPRSIHSSLYLIRALVLAVFVPPALLLAQNNTSNIEKLQFVQETLEVTEDEFKEANHTYIHALAVRSQHSSTYNGDAQRLDHWDHDF